MSDVAIFTDSTVPPEGRRTKVRQPLSSLAYVDIFPDNGGILLNLSEDGLAFQAVAPLHNQKQIQLVIQLPHSGARVEAAAEIVWLGSSTRQAGVRFLDMPAEARLQIREWIASQNPPGVDPSASTDLGPAQAASRDESDSPHKDVSSESRRGKWLGLMAEFEEAIEQQLEQKIEQHEDRSLDLLEKKSEEASEGVSPIAPNAPILSPTRPEVLSWPSAQRSSREPLYPSSVVPSQDFFGIQSTVSDFQRDRPSLRQTDLGELGADSEHLAISASKRREEAAQYVPDNEMASATAVHPGPPIVDSDFTLLRAAVVQTSPQPKSGDRQPEIAARKRDSLRSQIALVAVFALFSVLCFGIGTWVGNLPFGSADQQTSANAANVQRSSATSPAIPAQTNFMADGAPSAPNAAEREERRTRSTRLEGGRLRNSSATSAPSTVGQSPVQRAALPAVQTAGPDSQTLPPAVSSADQYAIASADNNGTPQSSPVDLSPQDPTPQVVDGYTLRPSDRFNPCHLTYRVDPVYPPQAQQQGIEGSVKIHLVIAADGSVESEKVIGGPPQLASAALDAAKYWRYLPALLNGEPVSTQKDVEITFHLPSH